MGYRPLQRAHVKAGSGRSKARNGRGVVRPLLLHQPVTQLRALVRAGANLFQLLLRAHQVATKVARSRALQRTDYSATLEAVGDQFVRGSLAMARGSSRCACCSV